MAQGLRPNARPRFSSRLFQGAKTARVLGLVASKIISDHDGWIALDSVPPHRGFRLHRAAWRVTDAPRGA